MNMIRKVMTPEAIAAHSALRKAMDKSPVSRRRHSLKAIDDALGYARWLRQKQFNDGLNKNLVSAGLDSAHRTPVRIDERGRALYDDLMRDLKSSGVVRLGNGDHEQIVKMLHAMRMSA